VELEKSPQIPVIVPARQAEKSSLKMRVTRCYARPPWSRLRSVQAAVERQIELTAESLWNDVAARLRGALNDQTYTTWFSEVAGLELEGDTFVVAVPNDFTREWIEGHFLDLIRAAVRDSGGPGLRVRFHVDEQRVPPPEPAPQAVPPSVRPLPVEAAVPARASPRASTRSTRSTPS